MTANEITLIISSVTALTAIVAPVISARISARSLERQKYIEQTGPQAYEALNGFIRAYSNLDAASDSYFYLQKHDTFGSNSGYRSFVVACHTLIPFIAELKLQNELCDFMRMILDTGKRTTRETDKWFDDITIKIGASLSGYKRARFKQK